MLEKPRTLAAHEFPIPEHGDDDAVLRVEACGLCGTDHEQYTGHLAGGFAFVPGHETVGVIESIGDIAAERWSVATGDRVAVEVFQSCRACDACRAGTYQRCERHGLADMYGYIPVEMPPGLWGGYAESQYLGPDAIVHRVPDVLDPVVATLFTRSGPVCVGPSRCPAQDRATSSRCSGRACGGCQRLRRRRTRAPHS